MKIVSVLRSGREYQAEHAQLLHAQLPIGSVCLTDLPHIEGVETVALQDKSLLGWWAKMELFNPDGPLGLDDLFYVDIDTVVLGDIQPLIDQAKQHRELVMLSDFFFPQHPASGVMYIPWKAKRRIWDAWVRNPDWHMVKHRPRGCVGDQGFIGSAAHRILRWDELCPGKIISYKKHIAAPGDVGYTSGKSIGDGKVPAGASIVCYHGNPRPWDKSCKPLLLDTTAASTGSHNSKTKSKGRRQLSITETAARSKDTSRRSKSQSK